MNEILNFVYQYTDISRELILSKSRKSDVITARFLCCYFFRVHLNSTFQEIADFIGYSEHGSAIHAVKTIEDRIEVERNFSKKVKDILSLIRSTKIEHVKPDYKEIVVKILKKKNISSIIDSQITRIQIYNDLNFNNNQIKKCESWSEKSTKKQQAMERRVLFRKLKRQISARQKIKIKSNLK